MSEPGAVATGQRVNLKTDEVRVNLSSIGSASQDNRPASEALFMKWCTKCGTAIAGQRLRFSKCVRNLHPSQISANCTARTMRDWANRIFRRSPAAGQRDCDELAAPVAGTALRYDGKNEGDRLRGDIRNFNNGLSPRGTRRLTLAQRSTVKPS